MSYARLHTGSTGPDGRLAPSCGSFRVGLGFSDAAYPFVDGRGGRSGMERQLSLTCEFLGAILWRAEPETLTFTYVSPRAQALLGYWLERWTGETNFWKKHLLPDDRELVVTACQRVVRERKREDFEFRMVGVHGQVLWFHAAVELIEHPGRKPELGGVITTLPASSAPRNAFAPSLPASCAYRMTSAAISAANSTIASANISPA